MKSLYDTYKTRGTKKYADGSWLSGLDTEEGGVDPNKVKPGAQIAGIGASVAGIAGNIADAVNPPNKYGRQGTGTNILKNVGSYASMGASFGPWGAAAGGAVGLVKGLIDSSNQKKEEAKAKWNEAFQNQQENLGRFQSAASQDPNITRGHVGTQYFAKGGELDSKPMLWMEFVQKKVNGGSLSRLSDNTVQVNGPSHEQGGVNVGGGNEVEGGETIKDGNYVFSERLGFAQMHKPIAKAIGQLETKAPSAPVINSLKRLRQQEDALQLLQEHVRQQSGLE